MTKLLLALVIWLRQYQGRGGNYYTIGNAVGMLTGLFAVILITFFIIADPTAQFIPIAKPVKLLIIFIASTVFYIVHMHLLLKALKTNRFFLKYRVYQRDLKLLFTLTMFFVLWLMVLEIVG